jgi:2-keto-4-pentenoate hydratase/2-oxohepta-3-ene-1,7-dioic acid hydratase in catechol pathway
MVFDVEALIVSLSDAFTLCAGDVIVTGTPGGIGMSHHPPLWMKPCVGVHNTGGQST